MVEKIKPNLVVSHQNYRYELTNKEFIDMTNCHKDNVCREIKRVSKSMVEQSTFLQKPDNKGFRAFSWFSEFDYDLEKGVWEVEVNSAFIPFLLDLKKYAKIEIESILKMNSAHAIQLYMLAKSYVHFCKKYKKPFKKSISEIKGILGIQSKYTNDNYSFKKKVLDSSITEINRKSDVEVKISFIKNGKQYSDVEFFVEQKYTSNTSIGLNSQDQVEEKSYNELKDYGFSMNASNNILTRVLTFSRYSLKICNT
jgi:plasmid replication initiation protein